MPSPSRFCLPLLAALFLPPGLPAASVSYDAVEEIISRHCLECHEAKDPEGGLSMESHAGLLKGGESGPAFSAGHDIGTPGRDINKPFERESLWWDHTNKPGAEQLFVREQEVYLGMCRRWHDIPKPTIAMVQGGCIAGGLMLAWICDLIIASDDAFFQDPVVRMGIPGVEYFAHVHELNPRIAKEFLFLGDRMTADRAYQMGMVNRVLPRAQLEAQTYAIATRIAQQPRMGLALTKTVINRVEELQGLRTSMDIAFGYHQFAHAHSQVLGEGALGGYDAKSMVAANKKGDTP